MGDLGFIIVKRRGDNPNLKDLQVKRNEIILSHRWLNGHNHLYFKIHANYGALLQIPANGQIPDEFLQIIIEEEEEKKEEEETKKSRSA